MPVPNTTAELINGVLVIEPDNPAAPLDLAINQAPDRSAGAPSLMAIGGVPYVAWSEYDGVSYEVRVSRLEAAGSAWQQLVGGASPINQADNGDAYAPSLAAIGGVPYVAWTEHDRCQQRAASEPPERGRDGLGADRRRTKPDQRHRGP